MDNELHKVEIKSEGAITKIKLDGNELKGVRCINYSHNAGESPVMKIELYTKVVTIDNPTVIDITNAFDNH
jgi:hypothetical protein